jgi:hypothetical protein
MSIGMQTYSAAGAVIVLGPNIITGFAEDTFIEIEYESDTFEIRKGADGGVSRSQLLDESGKVTITLKGESLSNNALSSLWASDKLLGVGVVPFMFADLTGTTKVTAAHAWIKKPPALDYGKNAGNRKWEIVLAKMNMTVGGTLPL